MDKPSFKIVNTARDLRKQSTTAEKQLWEQLRRKHLFNVRFRRQHPIGTFVTDFYCAEVKLIIEIDGSVHLEPTQNERDKAREEILRYYGCNVLRFSNNDVENRIEHVLEEIRNKIKELG